MFICRAGQGRGGEGRGGEGRGPHQMVNLMTTLDEPMTTLNDECDENIT